MTESAALEAEYRRHRHVVIGMLKDGFKGKVDPEELYQEAWTEALELQARGEEIRDFGALLPAIAWRRARDRVRKLHPASINPASRWITHQLDLEEGPDEVAEIHQGAAVIWHIVETLDPRQAAVIKLRHGRQLGTKALANELGITPKRLDKIVTKAYANVGEMLAAAEGEEPEWRRHQRSLLLACEAGIASASQRRRAEKMVNEDPACRALLAHIRAALDQIAAFVPLPLVTAATETNRVTRLRFGIADWFGSVRDSFADLVGRLLNHGSAVEQATAGSAISLTGSAAVKLALTCFAVAGTTVVCLTGPLSEHAKTREPKPPKPKAVAHHRTTAKPPDQIVHHIAYQVHKPPVVVRHVVQKHEQPKRTVPVSAPPPPSPAPPSSTEFGPGTTGSSSAPSMPAAAPASGGGEFTP